MERAANGSNKGFRQLAFSLLLVCNCAAATPKNDAEASRRNFYSTAVHLTMPEIGLQDVTRVPYSETTPEERTLWSRLVTRQCLIMATFTTDDPHVPKDLSLARAKAFYDLCVLGHTSSGSPAYEQLRRKTMVSYATAVQAGESAPFPSLD